MQPPRLILFDWGNTLMRDEPGQIGPMAAWPEVMAMAGAHTTLAWASQIAATGIATNAADSDIAAIRAALARVGLNGFIQYIFCQRQIGYSKAEPEFWQSVIAQTGIAAGDILMIGDQFFGDVAAARAAGLQAFWLDPAGDLVQLSDLPALCADKYTLSGQQTA